MKIEYVNKKPTYSKVVVSVVDHVECRCQAATRAPVPKKKSPHKHHGHQHRNETLSQENGHEQVQWECYFSLANYTSNKKNNLLLMWIAIVFAVRSSFTFLVILY